MKKLTLSIAAIAAMGTFAVAGGDIAPVEPVVETPAVVEAPSDAGFYVGGAYGLAKYSLDISKGPVSISGDENFNEFMILAGYKINQYVAIEGRYWFGSADDIDWLGNGSSYNTSIDAWGIYVKPMYPVTDAVDVYALLGYGSVDSTIKTPNADIVGSANGSDDGISWGLGASYAVNDNVGVFVDWIRNYDDTVTYNNNIDVDETIDTLNFGVTYKF